ncbi:hypothetical protein [Flavonifractor sp. HCP28S3_F3]|uniref:hypothetical protein n=1 Tax=Flavonifractor sp. HCP28S3_F3 TaxID=3438939 RepID=UPI003F88B4B1
MQERIGQTAGKLMLNCIGFPAASFFADTDFATAPMHLTAFCKIGTAFAFLLDNGRRSGAAPRKSVNKEEAQF